MIACYDLARCPPTYDVVAFLALAELERVKQGEDHLDIRILPGPASGFRRDTLWPRSVEERVQLRENVVVPMCWLLPSVRSVRVETDREVVGWGRDEYHISLPAIIKALQAGSRPLRSRRANTHRYITLTIREAEHHQQRNSRVEEWLVAADELHDRGLQIIVIPDAAAVGRRAGVFEDRAATDLARRAAIYSGSTLNVGICNGPMWMSIFMDAPTLMLRPTTNGAVGCYDDQFYAKFGLPRGSQLPTSPPHQRLVWEEDTCDHIVRAVEEMLEVAA